MARSKQASERVIQRCIFFVVLVAFRCVFLLASGWTDTYTFSKQQQKQRQHKLEIENAPNYSTVEIKHIEKYH